MKNIRVDQVTAVTSLADSRAQDLACVSWIKDCYKGSILKDLRRDLMI